MSAQRKAAIVIHGPISVIGGVERLNRYILELLHEMGCSVDVFEPSMVQAPAWMRRYAFPWVQYRETSGPLLGREKEYDLIITNGFTGGCLKAPNVVTICFGSLKSYQGALSQSFQNWKIQVTNYFGMCLDRHTMRTKKVIIAISDQVKGELKRDYGVESITVPCGIDMQHFKPRGPKEMLRKKYGIPSGKIVGAFVGRWAWNHKGLDALVPVMEKRDDIHWVVAADGNISMDRVRHKSVISAGHDQLPEIYSLADFCVMPSRYESFGLSFLESLACGTPVIATAIGIVPVIYDHPELKSLILSNPGREKLEAVQKEMHEKIDLLKNADYCASLGWAARQAVEKKYALAVWKESLRMIFERVMEKK